MAADPVRVAVVGAGRMGRVHLDALRRSTSAAPVAVVDPAEPALRAVQAAGLGAYADLDALLEAGGFDAVLVAAPSDKHRDVVTRLAAAGVPTLCEKPCGLHPDDARAVAEAVTSAGTLLQIGYWRRFVPELTALRERLAAGALGTPLHVACHQWDAEPPAPSFRARSGGIAIDMAVHEIDQLRWLLDEEVVDVWGTAAGAPGAGATPADPDTAIVLARLSGGAAATIALGRRFPAQDSCWLELIATEAHERSLFMWDRDGQRAFLEALVGQVDAFADAVCGAPPRGATIHDALEALIVAERLTAALASGSAGTMRVDGAAA